MKKRREKRKGEKRREEKSAALKVVASVREKGRERRERERERERMVSEERRPRRRAASRSKLGSGGPLPSAVHYVGYVEDHETDEMIMKKFEALERVQRAAVEKKEEEKLEEESKKKESEEKTEGNATHEEENNNLDESQLLEVFKQTSMFSVKSVQVSALLFQLVLIFSSSRERNAPLSSQTLTQPFLFTFPGRQRAVFRRPVFRRGRT